MQDVSKNENDQTNLLKSNLISMFECFFMLHHQSL